MIHPFSAALCKDDANGNVPLGKSCNRYWACQGGYPRLQRCPAMLVFDKKRKRCVSPPTEDCDVPPTTSPPDDEEGNGNGKGKRKNGGGGGGGENSNRRRFQQAQQLQLRYQWQYRYYPLVPAPALFAIFHACIFPYQSPPRMGTCI